MYNIGEGGVRVRKFLSVPVCILVLLSFLAGLSISFHVLPIGAIPQTRYMTSNAWSTGSYALSATQTSSYLEVSVGSGQPITVYGGIQVYVILSNQSRILVSNGTVAIASITETSTVNPWSISGKWIHDQINQPGVGVEADVFMDQNNPPTTLQATFKTENMSSFTDISNSTWTATYCGRSEYFGRPLDTTVMYFDFGSSTYNTRIDGFEVGPAQAPTTPPEIQDFYINNTWAGKTTQFAFNLTDTANLDHAVFGCNVTQTFTNDSSTPLFGTQAWANYTHTLPSFNCIVSFQLWVWNTNSSIFATTGLRYVKVYTYNSTLGAWNTPFISLSNAIQSVDSANNWTAAETYAQTILAKKTTADLANMIDGYASVGDWTDVLKWSAICNKLGVARENDIINALGNYTMVGSLPYTDSSSGNPDFVTESKWALYGHYYAIQYNVSLTKWNVTAAYQQFNSSIYTLGKPALWIYANGKAQSFSNRYYDEDACTIECYIIFAELLNVSGAMNDALYWWNYTDATHWYAAGQYYSYTPGGSIAECEASFFLKIISTLKYYSPSLTDWNRVLTDIGKRFLSSEWNSVQWVDSTTNTSTHVVVHASSNPQRRLENTLGAWQALLGVYLQLNSTYQNNMIDMLYGNNTEPAWSLLMRPEASLFNSSSDQFRVSSTSTSTDANSTAMAEILLFLLGIVPQSTTVAFPLEELNYEYTYDIDPQMFQFNLKNQTITIPVNDAGNMTFQYGVSPVTCNFGQSGVWQVTFSSSWNMITNATYVSALPSNLIYFTQIYALQPPLSYDVTIEAHCITEAADVSVAILLDGSLTGYSTPHTFTGLNGTHTFTVPDNDTNGDPFKQWNTSQTNTTITVSSAETFKAYYGPSPVHDVAVTDIALSKTVVGQKFSLNVSVAVGNPGDYPETFNVTLYANATAIENITVTNLSNATLTLIIFVWNTTGFAYGNYTLSAYAPPVPGETDISDNNFTGGWVLVAMVGDITGPNSWPDGKVDMRDIGLVARNFGQTVPPPNPNCDITGPTQGVPDGKIDMRDIGLVARHFGDHYP